MIPTSLALSNSGKRLHSELENHHFEKLKINDFNGHFQWQTVQLPESMCTSGWWFFFATPLKKK